MELAQQGRTSEPEDQVLVLRPGQPSFGKNIDQAPVKNIDQALQLDVLPHCPGILIGVISMQGI